MRTIEWSWDRDPADAQYRVEYVFVLRENGEVRDVHVEGLFARAQWVGALEGAGFQVEVSDQLVDEGVIVPFFLARKP